MVVTWLVVAVVLALVIGSVAEINAQSASERQMTDRGWGELASRVALASTQTGAQLAALVRDAPAIPNEPWSSTNGASDRFVPSPGSNSARMQIQQGLDASVAAADQESVEASQLAPPGPAGGATNRFAAVMAARAATATSVRTTIDDLLGMAPLPVAGAPAPAPGDPTTLASGGVPRVTLDQATTQATAEGAAFEASDRAYAALAAQLRSGGSGGTTPIHLPRSAWAPPGTPLTSADLGATPALLAPPDGSAALVPYHLLVVTAVGLVPPAVPSTTPGDQAGSGIVGTACSDPTSAVPGTTATVLPPTPTVAAQVTVTNCGTVTESDIPVTETLALKDPPGTKPPPVAASGGTLRTNVTILAGGSQALDLGGLPVAGGHNYTLTIALVTPPPPAGQADLTGTTQEFLLQITA